MKQAFSYIRFSTPEQAEGDSFRRQTDLAEEWAAKNGYKIVKSWEDLGVSGFRGKNAISGNFADFLKAAEAGELEEGSVLIIENLDRMSRRQPIDALPMFLDILKWGVGIATLSNGKLYTKDSLRKDRTQLFETLFVMFRANDESTTKSERGAATWTMKRAKAREKGIALTDRIPGWLNSKRDALGQRVFSENHKRVEIVQRIFAETVQGYGRRAIAKGLNRDGKDPFVSKSGWQPSSVIKIIRSRTAIGEYQPHRHDEDGKRLPDGEPIVSYYPTVIDEALWVRANSAVDLRRSKSAGRPQAEVANLLRGLAFCSQCKKKMLFLNKGKPPKGGCYYVCSQAARDADCGNKRLWPAKNVERWLLHQLDSARIVEAFEPAAKMTGPSPKEYDLQIAKMEALMSSALDAWLPHKDGELGPHLEKKAKALSIEIKRVQKLRDQVAAAERARPHLPTVKSAIETAAMLAEKLANATAVQRNVIRTAIIQQLRTVFAEIRFWPHEIVGLIELPDEPKSMKGPFGSPGPFEVKSDDNIKRFFFRHQIYTDDPGVMAEMDGGKGVLNARFSGNA